MREKEIRVELADANETLGKRIREGEIQKIPYLLVVGDREESAKSVNVRRYGKGEQGTMNIDEIIKKITKEISERSS